ncbi:MAG: MipA/OmpV family protein [Nitrospina sp.]|nr:MipA/OmpV family protein [Nitrospina sp.]
MFPRSAEKFRFIFIPVVLFIILFSPVVPLWAKSLKVDSPWLTSGRNNQLLKIRFYDQIFFNTSKVKIDLGVGVQVASYQYNPKEKELFLKIKSVAKETNLGPRPLIIKIPSKRTTLKNSKYKQIKSKIWIFSPGMVKVDQSHSGKENVIRLKITGKNTHFKKGRTRIIFKNRNGITVNQDNVFVENSTYLTANVNLSNTVQPGKYSFYVETLKKNQDEALEILFAPKALKIFSSSSKILDQRKIWGAQKKDWSIMLGGITFLSPDYEGSDDVKVQGFPFFDVSWRNRFFLNFQQGLGMNIIRNKNLIFGTSVGYYGSREEGDNEALRGLGDIDGGVDGRLFVFVPVGPISFTSMYRRDLSGNHDGAILSVGALYFKPVTKKLRINLQGRLNYASEKFMNTYFDINLSQASRSKMTAYDADAGIKDISGFNILIYSFTRHWNVVSFMGFSRLLGDAANSPIVKERGTANQFRFGLGFSYRF